MLAIILISSNVYATAQFAEILHYKGKKHFMFSTPLESYFSFENPKPPLFKFESTACWRGYIGEWEIKDEFLYLVSLKNCDGKQEIPIEKIMQGKKPPVKATWFSGILRIPQGKMLRYVHMGFESQYEKDFFIWIENGKVVREEIIQNRKIPR